MTTTITQPQTAYEPTVQDRIQRVLYRLDNGEKLIEGSLRRDNNFCVLGLFADEYPGRTWLPAEIDDDPIDGTQLFTCVDEDWAADSYTLTHNITTYYGFKDVAGTFALVDIPKDELRTTLESLLARDSELSLSKLNDLLLFAVELNKNLQPNEILAGVIRSGALFTTDLPE